MGSPLDYEAYIFDLDGTIYLGEKLIPQADTVVSFLRSNNKRILFLSNKPLASRADYAHKLTRLGIPTTADEVINSSHVLAQYLATNHPNASLYVIGEDSLLKDLRDVGLNIVEKPVDKDYHIDFVIASFDRRFSYAKLNTALQAIRKGARLFATNADATCPVPGGEIPDAAGVIGAILATTGCALEFVAGKPNTATTDMVLNLLGLPAWQCCLVGDRLETDILMGKNAGMATVLVLSGVTQVGQLSQNSIKPDYVFPSIAEFLRKKL